MYIIIIIIIFCQNRARWFLHTSWLPVQMHFANTWPGQSHWIRVSFAQYYPGLLWKNGTKLDAGSWIQNMIRPNSGCTMDVTAIARYIQNTSESDPACLLGALVAWVKVTYTNTILQCNPVACNWLLCGGFCIVNGQIFCSLLLLACIGLGMQDSIESKLSPLINIT